MIHILDINILTGQIVPDKLNILYFILQAD